MKSSITIPMDGNEATAHVAYRLNEICAIYPITPSSTMAELADEWSAEKRPNIWGAVPTVIEMQSEGGAAGTVHGALQTGALSTTFTASQGLLLMIPNMFKIAGELTPTVFHVAARAVAAHALSIFGDHSDVMAARSTGFALLASSSVQEAHDFAAIAQAATLRARVPFIHFFDGFRTSHEISKVQVLSDDDLAFLIDEELVLSHRARGLSPEQPFIRGTAQNPDVFFQSREAVSSFYAKAPDIVADAMNAFASRTGRRYRLFDYVGHPRAERVVVVMGSAAQTAAEVVDAMVASGERIGVLKVRLFRPFSIAHFLEALPTTVECVAVLDRTKEPGATGEPLYQDIVTACSEARAGNLRDKMPKIIGGRYGLGSKELTPGMMKAVFDELSRPTPRNHFTVGITDDVTHTSLAVDASFLTENKTGVNAIFFGLGADGTVGANKNTIKIIAEDPSLHVQGYFVYDSKKSGSQTVSHLRFGPDPIRSEYLIQEADFIACHQFGFLDRTNVLENAKLESTFLLDAPFPPDRVVAELPQDVVDTLVAKRIAFWVIDAKDVARRAGLGTITSTIMQTCFFAISGVLPKDIALAKIRASIEKTYEAKGRDVIAKNFAAVDLTLAALHQVALAPGVQTTKLHLPIVPAHAPDFVRNVTATLMAGHGDSVPVSALPVDGTYPSATAKWEKRNIAQLVPEWNPEVCVQCGNCSFVCPHSVIRSKFYDKNQLANAPPSWKSAPIDARGFPDVRYTLEVYVEDCTGCALCVEACPVHVDQQTNHRAIHMVAKGPLLDSSRANIRYFETLPYNDRSRVDFSTVRGTQFLEPLFEFSGACAGCGETPYLKLLSQLFGDRLIVANATGCSSIYGGNLPTTPWSQNAEGHGPAWSNSLFEDNAEFGLGFRLAADAHLNEATRLLTEHRGVLGNDLVEEVLTAPQRLESQIRQQRARVAELERRLAKLDHKTASRLASVVHQLVRRSVWIVGGDGWAYDIGAGGLDHVLSTGRDVNILVLDTEVYSNTGGQASKATPMAAVAKFAAAGKTVGKKDLALMAIAYGNVYVARVAFGANPQQTLLALREAEAFPGPSLVIAYGHCIAHGINMQDGLKQQELAVTSGYWPLMRHNPAVRELGENPFMLDSGEPRTSFREYAYNELRYRALRQANPEVAEALMKEAEKATRARYQRYAELRSLKPSTTSGSMSDQSSSSEAIQEADCRFLAAP